MVKICYYVHHLDVHNRGCMTILATERLNIRATTDAKNVIEQAANLLGLSMSSFMLQSAFDRAQDVLESTYNLTVNTTDRNMLMDLLENPRPANDEMKNLMGMLDEN